MASHQVRASAPPSPEAWGLVVESLPDASAQMAMDQVLAESVWCGRRPPTLRLYRWPVPGITLGRHQPDGPLPGPAVRRMTGGHAVFHDHELTFSLAVPAGHRLLAGGPRAAYRTVAAACEAALNRLGLPVTRGNPHAPERPRRVFSCFTGATREETALDGHKLVAVAQRHTRRGLLVQGSIPLSAPSRLPGADRSGMLGLDRLLPAVNWHRLAGALTQDFAEWLGARFLPAPIEGGERRAVSRMACNHYTPLTGADPGRPRPPSGTKKPLKKPLF